MELRKDFVGVAPYMHRLWGIGQEFGKFNRTDWPHGKNNEDFQQVYRMELSRRQYFEFVYSEGRDMAIFMSGHLCAFNSVAEFPTLASFVDSFEKNWCARIDHWDSRIAEMKEHTKAQDVPWSVHQMVELWEQQVRLLKAVNETVAVLKQSNEYRIEKGELKLSEIGKQSISVNMTGNVTNSRINVASTDNSTNITVKARDVFMSMRETMERAELPAADKGRLAECIDSMEAETGKPGFLQRYLDFMTAAANHMTVFEPYLAPLAELLKG